MGAATTSIAVELLVRGVLRPFGRTARCRMAEAALSIGIARRIGILTLNVL